jgi:hypothetical protein
MKNSVNVYKVVCYVSLALVGYFVFLKDLYFLDRRLLGSGDIYRIYEGYPLKTI